jgi:hypothetical protein
MRFVLAAALLILAGCATPQPIQDQAVCVEDMDCWVCSEMGNKICGKE